MCCWAVASGGSFGDCACRKVDEGAECGHSRSLLGTMCLLKGTGSCFDDFGWCFIVYDLVWRSEEVQSNRQNQADATATKYFLF